MAILGEQVLVELVSAIGFYSMVAMTLNAFAVSVPGEVSRWFERAKLFRVQSSRRRKSQPHSI
jgi:hypothetical protein